MFEKRSFRGLGASFFRILLISAASGLIASFVISGPPLFAIQAGAAVFLMFAAAELFFRLCGWNSTGSFSLPQLLKRTLIIAFLLLALAISKFFWLSHFAPNGQALLLGGMRDDLLERRAYLLETVAAETFGVKDIPSIVESPFREELAIATLSMTTVALTNLTFLEPQTRDSSRDAIARMIEKMLSREIRRYEVIWWGRDALESLDRDEGQIGYLGHLNLMLGCYRLLGGDARYDKIHQDVSSALARRMRKGSGFHTETFPGAIFTADNTFVVLSLRVHDQVSAPEYGGLIHDWVDYSRTHLIEQESGMLRYYVDSEGHAQGTARGVLQAWNSMWLPLIDEAWATDQYLRMKANLKDQIVSLNLQGVREYPVGVNGPSDMISGPIIAGVSSAATGFAIGGAVLMKDAEFLTGLLRTAEVVGGTVSWKGKRFYLFAPLVGEAVVLAAKTMNRWDDRYVLH